MSRLSNIHFWKDLRIFAIIFAIFFTVIIPALLLISTLVRELGELRGNPPKFIQGVLMTPFSVKVATPYGGTEDTHLKAYVFKGSNFQDLSTTDLDCNSPCASKRKPLIVKDPAEDCIHSIDESTTPQRVEHCAPPYMTMKKRSGHILQWAYKDLPVYYYPDPHQVPEPGWEPITYFKFQNGHLVDEDGFTIYVRNKGPERFSDYKNLQDFTKQMKPFFVPSYFSVNSWETNSHQVFTWYTDLDSSQETPLKEKSQWSYKWQFFYHSELDKSPGDLNGLNIPNHLWKLVTPQSGPVMDTCCYIEPDKDWSEFGQVRILTIKEYEIPVFISTDRTKGGFCEPECLKNFSPLLVRLNPSQWDGADKEFDVTMIKNPNGLEQWAYKNQALYYPKNAMQLEKSKEYDYRELANKSKLKYIVLHTCYVNSDAKACSEALAKHLKNSP